MDDVEQYDVVRIDLDDPESVEAFLKGNLDMSHHSIESMRDRAFRKGRNAFKNDAEYRAALAGELDDSSTADGIDAARDILDDYLLTADYIDEIRDWLEKVMATENGDDLPPNLELEDVDGGTIRFETLGSADRVGLREPDNRYCEIAVTDLQDLLDDLEPYEDDFVVDTESYKDDEIVDDDNDDYDEE